MVPAEFHLGAGRSKRPTPAHLEAAEPATGIRGLLHFHKLINPKDPDQRKEVTGMSLALASLDVRVEPGVDDRLRVSARGVKSDLPCRTFDPDLWFADVPA